MGEGKVNCIHSTWGRAVNFYVETKYDLDPHRAASNAAQVSSAPTRGPGTGREVTPRLVGTVLGKYCTYTYSQYCSHLIYDKG